MKFAVTAALAAALALALPTAAAAVVGELSPAPGATATTALPQFSWTLPTGERANHFKLSDQSKVDANGVLSGNELFAKDLAPGATSVTLPKTAALSMGNYWWQVESYDAAGADTLTPALKLVVPGLLQFGPITEKAGMNPSDHMMEAEFNGWVRGNLPDQCIQHLIVKKGAKTLYRSDNRQQDCNAWSKIHVFDNWQDPKVKKGAKLTAKIWVTWRKLHWDAPDISFRAP